MSSGLRFAFLAVGGILVLAGMALWIDWRGARRWYLENRATNRRMFGFAFGSPEGDQRAAVRNGPLAVVVGAVFIAAAFSSG